MLCVLLRFTAKQALRHPYFAELREAEIRVLRARQDQSISEMSSLRGSAMAGPLNRRQHQILQVGHSRLPSSQLWCLHRRVHVPSCIRCCMVTLFVLFVTVGRISGKKSTSSQYSSKVLTLKCRSFLFVYILRITYVVTF